MRRAAQSRKKISKDGSNISNTRCRVLPDLQKPSSEWKNTSRQEPITGIFLKNYFFLQGVEINFSEIVMEG